MSPNLTHLYSVCLPVFHLLIANIRLIVTTNTRLVGIPT